MNKAHSLVVGINYNSDKSALEFVRTLREISSPKNVTIILIDNTEREDSSEFFDYVWDVCPSIKCIKPSKNLGYFGGAHFGLTEYLRFSNYPDWVIVSNVDIEFNNDSFFDYLHKTNPITSDIGAIAPSIWNIDYKKDSNPHILKRLAGFQIKFYKIMYRFYPLAFVYFLTARARYILRDKMLFKQTSVQKLEQNIVSQNDTKTVYAPHGSCIIFSRLYFLNGGTLNYPSFLFQEEIFVAEEVRKTGLKVVYAPRLQVNHRGHVSTGYILSPRMARFFFESTTKIAELYYSE